MSKIFKNKRKSLNDTCLLKILQLNLALDFIQFSGYCIFINSLGIENGKGVNFVVKSKFCPFGRDEFLIKVKLNCYSFIVSLRRYAGNIFIRRAGQAGNSWRPQWVTSSDFPTGVVFPGRSWMHFSVENTGATVLFPRLFRFSLLK
jgi:hypothetical protein